MKLELSTRINAISANKCKCCNKKDKDLRFGFSKIIMFDNKVNYEIIK